MIGTRCSLSVEPVQLAHGALRRNPVIAAAHQGGLGRAKTGRIEIVLPGNADEREKSIPMDCTRCKGRHP
jgi:hypothetical protein